MLECPTCYVQWKPPSRAYKLYHMLQNHQCLFLNVVVALIKLLDYLSLVQTDNPNWNLMFHHLHRQENGSKNLRQIILFFFYFHLDSILLQSIFLGDFLPVQVGLFHSMCSKDIKLFPCHWLEETFCMRILDSSLAPLFLLLQFLNNFRPPLVAAFFFIFFFVAFIIITFCLISSSCWFYLWKWLIKLFQSRYNWTIRIYYSSFLAVALYRCLLDTIVFLKT